jgi:hypothetical protein
LEKITLYTRRTGRKHRLITKADFAADPQGAQSFALEYEDCTNRQEIELGRQVASSGLIAQNGAYDQAAMLLFKGQWLASKLVKAWDLKTAGGDALPVTPENVELLPRPVLVDFGLVALYGTNEADTGGENEAGGESGAGSDEESEKN